MVSSASASRSLARRIGNLFYLRIWNWFNPTSILLAVSSAVQSILDSWPPVSFTTNFDLPVNIRNNLCPARSWIPALYNTLVLHLHGCCVGWIHIN
ncbi:hypothetical protein BDP27DRAFT_917944 [Rhodocollybia butyracea]|uniref:Uncharacterized protein n=1 Tax=Rhodocollybia butyracea TaxID=206335 RepID=A0A9P5PQ61_9AGAR|nr:hypothetical protein BDP27DRAFT_917944 [Rhodocollybia butyracea]